MIKRFERLSGSLNLVLCSGVFVLSIFLHVLLGMDEFWDTANYHIFLGWSAATLNFGTFGAAAQYHSYLNPLIDLVNYLTFFTHPYIGAGFHSLIYVAFAYAILKILDLFLTDSIEDLTLKLIGLAIGISGAMTISLFGSWTNENIVAVPVLIGVYFLLVGMNTSARANFMLAGLALGMSAGLKLTALHYVAGALVASMICAPRIRQTALLCVGIVLGYVLIDGFFAYTRFSLTGNPVFPLANNLFRSPYYPEDWKSFSTFEPSKILYYLSLPFRWTFSSDFSEASSIRDARILFGFIAVTLLVIRAASIRRIERRRAALIVVFVASFAAWIVFFRIYRYLIVLEALSGILTVLAVKSCLPSSRRYVAPLLALLLIPILVYITHYPNWGRRAWSAEFIRSNIVQMIGSSSNAVALFADQRVSFLAPELFEIRVPFASLYAQEWWDGKRGEDIHDPDSSRDPQVLKIDPDKETYFLQVTRFDPREKSSHLRAVFAGQFYQCTEVKTDSTWTPSLCSYKDESELRPLKSGVDYNPSAQELIFQSGWSYGEPNQRWTEGKAANLILVIDEDRSCSPSIGIRGSTLGDQRLGLRVNGIAFGEQIVTGTFTKRIDLPESKAGRRLVSFEFSLPDARPPGNGDPRKLAIALSSVTLSCR